MCVDAIVFLRRATAYLEFPTRPRLGVPVGRCRGWRQRGCLVGAGSVRGSDRGWPDGGTYRSAAHEPVRPGWWWSPVVMPSGLRGARRRPLVDRLRPPLPPVHDGRAVGRGAGAGGRPAAGGCGVPDLDVVAGGPVDPATPAVPHRPGRAQTVPKRMFTTGPPPSHSLGNSLGNVGNQKGRFPRFRRSRP